MTGNQTPQKLGFCGFFNVLKPPGMSSAQVVSRVRRLLDGEKVGHAGTLDPEAAGVLPLMVGKAARLFDYLQDKEKVYVAEVAFGSATDTQDAQGEPIAFGNTFPEETAIRDTLPAFIGQQNQVPPMFSALKRDGRRLYDLARQGETVSLEARPVTVHELEMTAVTPNHGAMLHLRCSKGFYVRTLCFDLGRALGCPSHMRFLLRTQSGPFTLDTAQPLETLQAAAQAGTLAVYLLPMEAALTHLPTVDVPDRLVKPLCNGIPLQLETLPGGETIPDGKPVCLRVRGKLLAIGERNAATVRQRTWLGE